MKDNVVAFFAGAVAMFIITVAVIESPAKQVHTIKQLEQKVVLQHDVLMQLKQNNDVLAAFALLSHPDEDDPVHRLIMSLKKADEQAVKEAVNAQ